MIEKHAKLSASKSSRWLNCPGSIKAEEEFIKKYGKKPQSEYALEGSVAHELADICLRNELNPLDYIGEFHYENNVYEITKEMALYVEQYLDYIYTFKTENHVLFVEYKVSYAHLVKDGFGTLDAAYLDYDNDIIHIFDFKYGRIVEVDAINNTQAQLYALGLIHQLKLKNIFKKVHIHIIQPRLSNFSEWTISIEDLLKFGDIVKEKALLALSNNPPRIAGEKQCEWCEAKSECKILAKYVNNIISNDFDYLDCKNIETLTDLEKKDILDNKKIIYEFLKAVEANIFEIITSGKSFPGYKIVEGRSNRKWTPNAEIELNKILNEEELYEKKLIGITKAQSLIGKEKVDELTEKGEGKLTLVEEKDKREAIIFDPLNFEVLND